MRTATLLTRFMVALALSACGSDHTPPSAAGAKPLAIKPVPSAAPPSAAVASTSNSAHAPASADDTSRRTPEQSDAALQASCAAADQAACVAWAERLRATPQASAEVLAHALELYSTACGRHAADGCAGLGIMYQAGLSVKADLTHAIDLYRQSCEAKSGRGCSRLGALYALGDGVAPDAERAHGYSEQGCELGDGLGCVNLGLMYQHGENVGQDSKRAAELYAKSCAAGEGQGCRELGSLQASGFADQPANPKMAVMWSERACALHDAAGCGNAGMNYQVGFGVPQDSARAAHYYHSACELGDQRFCQLLERFKQRAAAGPGAATH